MITSSFSTLCELTSGRNEKSDFVGLWATVMVSVVGKFQELKSFPYRENDHLLPIYSEL